MNCLEKIVLERVVNAFSRQHANLKISKFLNHWMSRSRARSRVHMVSGCDTHPVESAHAGTWNSVSMIIEFLGFLRPTATI